MSSDNHAPPNITEAAQRVLDGNYTQCDAQNIAAHILAQPAPAFAPDHAALIDEVRRVKMLNKHSLITRLADALEASNAREAQVRKRAAGDVEKAYKSGITETSSMPGPRIIEQMWQDSEARRAALDIAGEVASNG